MLRLQVLAVAFVLPLFVFSCSKQRVSVYDIKFGSGLGPLNFKMTKTEVQKELGEPSFETGKVLTYKEKGLAIVLNRKGVIGAIICGSMDGDSQLMANFKGTSNKGITLGASSEDVVKAYGQPSEVREGGNFLRFDTLSTDFHLKENRVVCITLRHESTGQTNEP